MKIVHLTASAFYGGPERQMLGLARHLPRGYETRFLSFAEGGRCRAFLSAARRCGFEAAALEADTPRFGAARREIADYLERAGADVLLCHGYKADLLGRPAARRAGIPAVAVSRGWTGECFRVRLYERIDRFFLRWMDRVVGVSEAQAERVRRAGVRPDKVRVIHNAVDTDRFPEPDPRYREKLSKYFRIPKTRIVGAAGRLSPEKGFAVLVHAAERVVHQDPSVGFILFGEGAAGSALRHQVRAADLADSFVFDGFRNDLDSFLPWFDVLALPSFTEGLPNIALEACAASVAVVGTAVGGTPEIIEDGVNGHLVPAGDADALAKRLLDVLGSETSRRDLGLAGRQKVVDQFGFAAQADRYCDLFADLGLGTPDPADDGPDTEDDVPAEYGDPVGAGRPAPPAPTSDGDGAKAGAQGLDTARMIPTDVVAMGA
jgi:glycosyltransferase involved in cell wall biosynthesis